MGMLADWGNQFNQGMTGNVSQYPIQNGMRQLPFMTQMGMVASMATMYGMTADLPAFRDSSYWISKNGNMIPTPGHQLLDNFNALNIPSKYSSNFTSASDPAEIINTIKNLGHIRANIFPEVINLDLTNDALKNMVPTTRNYIINAVREGKTVGLKIGENYNEIKPFDVNGIRGILGK